MISQKLLLTITIVGICSLTKAQLPDWIITSNLKGECNKLENLLNFTDDDSTRIILNARLFDAIKRIPKTDNNFLFIENKYEVNTFYNILDEKNNYNLDSVTRVLNNSNAIFIKNKNIRMQCRVHLLLTCLYTNTNNLIEAKKYSVKSFETAEKCNQNYDLLSMAYNFKANILSAEGIYKSAIETYKEGLILAIKGKCVDNQLTILVRLAELCSNMHDFKNAEINFLQSIEISKKNNSTSGLAYAYNGLANVYENINKYDQAISFYEKAMQLRKEKNEKVGYCFSLMNYAYLLGKTKDYKKSLSLFSEAEIELLRLNHNRGLAALYQLMGQYYLGNTKNYKKVIFYANKSATINNNVKKHLEKNLIPYKNLSETYFKLNDFKNAYLYQFLYDSLFYNKLNIKNRTLLVENQLSIEYEKKSIADSILSANEKFIASAKLSKERNQKFGFGSLALLTLGGIGFIFYQFKQKQKTNSQLTSINDKINKQNNTLKTLNTELIESEEKLTTANNSKEQLISMMSHDLLNPITAITNYNQQIISKKTSNEDLMQAFKTVDAAIQPMHGLLDNMLQWTAIQKDGIKAKLKKQDVNEIAKEIIGIYRPQANLKFIKINDALQDGFVMETDKSILSLILRNLLNNAIKYSANDTSILVTTNATEKTITIQDEGFGMTDEMIGYLNRKQIDKIEAKGSGLGLKLCYEFVEAVGGKIKFEKRNPNGVIVTIKMA